PSITVVSPGAPPVPLPPPPPSAGLPTTPRPVQPPVPTVSEVPPPGIPFTASLPVPVPAPPTTPPAPITCPWAVLVETVEGRSSLKILSHNEVHFRVSCARLDLQSPPGCLQARGAVQVTGAGLEATCDQFTISWEQDKVL